MSGKETKLDDLNVELSKEEEDIVDSIINELNGDEPEPQPQQRPPQQRPPQQRPPQQRPPQQRPPQQMPPQQMPPNMPPNMPQQGMPQQGMPPNMPPNMPQQGMPPNMMQQQMMQQQMMQQKMMQQKMMEEQMKEKEKVEEISMMDKIKKDTKEPSIVAFLTLLMLLPQTNGIITSTKLALFLNADGSINLYGLMIKAILAGILFFIFKKYV